MKKNILKIITVITISLIMPSCSDYLELEPKDNLIQQEFWKSKEQVSAAVAGCYASMNQADFTSKALLWGELRAEMLVSVRAGNNERNMLKNYILPTSSLVKWNSFYKTINFCNLVLDFADEAKENDLSFTEEELKAFKAEARAIRSLVYFILVRNFKEVPLILVGTSSNEVDFYPAKNTEEEILAQIISDLKLCVQDLPVGYAKSIKHDKGKINKGSALAILADVYLWANQYNNCIDACNEIIALGKYNLVEGTEWFNQIFFEGNSTEGIFELQFSDINTTFKNYFYELSPYFAPFGGTQDLYEEIPNDIRGERASYDLSRNSVFKYSGVDASAGVFRTTQEFFNTFIFYRYSDVLLMQAEAYLLSTDRQDLNQAYSLINQVHERATGAVLGAVISQTTLLDAVLLERQKEFAFEGKRWYDLLRFDRRNDFSELLILTMAEEKTTADDYEVIISNFTDPESYFLPIDQNEINLNRNLEQNPYYIN
ncbi:RagB/SusD family nutrient uptake outer membrane protein [Flavicella sediminum]|uniref:RagB/SusD family nutrient uptake outer membrane protein n=1 Tax=Flavicella sediminum TaxID=2585141 RepID=UPI0011219A9D|nr:RagB/SusD family nutrient uptake outer membrane protein [Flavicella sediminum]